MKRNLKKTLLGILGKKIAGSLDYLRFPNMKNNPTSFTAQKYRKYFAQVLKDNYKIQNIIETGSYKGDTTHYFRQLFNRPTYTVELDERHFGFVKTRFFFDNLVSVWFGHSKDFLKDLININIHKTKTLFYLDAHWGHDLPLKAELDLILNNWENFVIIIDDFKVPGIPYYTFDRYKEKNEEGIYDFTKVLSLELIEEQLNNDIKIFYPSLIENPELSNNPGWVCLVKGEEHIYSKLLKLDYLKEFQSHQG